MNKGFSGKEAGFSVDKAFNESFGDVLSVSDDAFEGMSKEYFNPFTGVDLRSVAKDSFATLNKEIATTTGGPGTAGTAMVPVWVDSNIVDRTIRETPLRSLLPRRAVKGMTYDYVPLTAKGGATFYAEGATIADQTDTFDRESVTMKFAYARGKVTGQAMAAMRGFIDPMKLDLNIKAQSLLELEEETIINGDASVTTEEFSGLIKLIATNTTDMGSGTPTLAQIRAEFAISYNSNGQINLAVTDATTHNVIKGLLWTVQMKTDAPEQSEPGFGISDAFKFDGVLFIRDKFMPTTTNQKRILFLDTRYVFMAVLQDITYEEKASTDDYATYIMKEYLALVVSHEAACTQMYAIA